MRQLGGRKLAFVSSWHSPKFKIGQWVEKWTGDYTGPGIVRGISTLASGRLRYLVGHRIDGGIGEFLHVYVERGEVRSRRSYAAFKAALDEGRQDDDGGASAN